MFLTISSTFKPLQRGFNLVEAAIVLGVVGLVIGGIWVAASAVNSKNNVNNFVKDINTIVQGVRNYGNANLWIGPAGGSTASIGFNDELLSMGIAPSNWIYKTSTSYLYDPYFNSIIYVVISNAPSSVGRFEIHIEADDTGTRSFSVADCINITSSLYVSLKNTSAVVANNPYSNVMRVSNTSGSTNQRTLDSTAPSFVSNNPCSGLATPWSITLYVPF